MDPETQEYLLDLSTQVEPAKMFKVDGEPFKLLTLDHFSEAEEASIMGSFLGAGFIILMPILYPVAQSFGLDLLHFCVVVSVNLSIGLVTPPYGATLFVACSIAKMSIREVTPALLPSLLVMIVAQALITFIPPLTTWLPRLFIP